MIKNIICLIALSTFGLHNLSCSLGKSVITIRVKPPYSTPAGARVFIAGNHELAGDWDPGKIRMESVVDSIWEARLELPEKFLFEFKITRGTWNSQAIYGNGGIPPNHSVLIGSDSTITLEPVSWQDLGSSSVTGVTGSVRYHRNIAGEGLNYPRDLIVWMPPGYEKDTMRRYPVLYMHDGQNIIDPVTSFTGYDWHVDEVADSLLTGGKMREIIVVGIYNSPDRSDEYDDTPLGRLYMKFIVEIVKPLIDANYRTLPDRASTATMGSSMGGLISFLIVWNHSGIFSQAGCVSPLFRDDLISAVKKDGGTDKEIRIYIDNGGVGLESELRPGCDKMIIALKESGYREGNNLEWFFDEKAEHNERAWASRVWRPLLFMFSRGK